MVLIPVTFKSDRSLSEFGEPKVKIAQGYAHDDIPGLAIEVKNAGEPWYDIAHLPTGYGFRYDFGSLSEAARYLELLGTLANWPSVEPGNNLHTALAPVMKLLYIQQQKENNARYAEEEVKEAVERAAEAQRDLTKARKGAAKAIRAFKKVQP